MSCRLLQTEQHIPCLNWVQATIRNNKLILHVIFRSNDCYSAFPSNMLFIKAPETTDDFLSAFMQSYILWIIPSFFKNIIFGCLWFCNDRGFILKNTEHMTKLYKDRSFFILRFIRLSVSGMILSVGFAFLAG